MNRLLILSERAGQYADLLRAQDLPDVQIAVAAHEAQGAKWISQAEIILGQPAMVASLLDKAGRLRWVQSVYAGVENLCRPGLRTDYLLTGVKGVFGPLISEYVFAYILALERRMFQMRQNQQERLWRRVPYRRLSDLTLGVCGLGSIGRHVAGTARHFNMRVTGYKHSPASVAECDLVFTPPDFHEFLKTPDYLVLALPDTRKTRGLMDTDALRGLKPGAVLINVGRGSAIVENDLIKALDQGWVAAAVLDVFVHEPLQADSPLWTQPNAWITPHNSGTSFVEDIVPIFCENYRRFTQGRELNHVVDFSKGY